jgi:hypothetical protein
MKVATIKFDPKTKKLNVEYTIEFVDSKEETKFEILDIVSEYFFDEYQVLAEKLNPHVACYSYPDCDINPNGCRVENGNDAEPIGWRD